MKPSTTTWNKPRLHNSARALRLPAVADQCASLAEEAIKQRLTYLRYLESVAGNRTEERERQHHPPGGSRMLICRA